MRRLTELPFFDQISSSLDTTDHWLADQGRSTSGGRTALGGYSRRGGVWTTLGKVVGLPTFLLLTSYHAAMKL